MPRTATTFELKNFFDFDDGAFADSKSPYSYEGYQIPASFYQFPTTGPRLPLGKYPKRCYIKDNVKIEAPCLRPVMVRAAP